MDAWFPRALLIWSTSMSFDHKRDFQISNEYYRHDLIRVKLQLAIT